MLHPTHLQTAGREVAVLPHIVDEESESRGWADVDKVGFSPEFFMTRIHLSSLVFHFIQRLDSRNGSCVGFDGALGLCAREWCGACQAGSERPGGSSAVSVPHSPPLGCPWAQSQALSWA